jgi:4-phytase/acid phosphatase
VGNDFNAVEQAHRDSLETLQSILECCSPKLCNGRPNCTLLSLGSKLEEKDKGGISLTRTLGIASTVAETLLLEYAQGFPDEQVGWGRADRAKLLRALRMHTLEFELMERTPYIARRQGSELLQQVLLALRSGPDARWGRQCVAPWGAKFVAFVGHDTNIANVAAMLGVSWQQPGYQMNDTPPAGALAFELRRGRDGRLRVYTSYIAQSMEQMRDMQRLDLKHPPARAALYVPGCSAAEAGYPCLLDDFEGAAKQAIEPACVLRK